MNNKERFLSPSREFTPIPFWFWNDDLTRDELERQIADFDSKGVNGFVIHPRMGLSERIEYLSDEYMELVRFAVEQAARRDMCVVLYDEAAYPSGSAHGLVVRSNPDFASKGLRMSESDRLESGEKLVAELWVRESDGSVSEYEREGCTRLSFIEQFSHGTIRGIHYGEDDGQPNAPASGDILNPAAVARFIELTHERYYSYLSDYFGSTVIAFFCDEPDILGRAHDKGLIAWSDGFLSKFLENGGKITDLPALFAEGENPAKEIYERTIHQTLSGSFYRQIADWCRAHSIELTGHPAKSDDIGYLADFGIPCQDVVWRYVAPEDKLGVIGTHSTMGKCASDSARHRGKRRCGNEALGCCGPKGDLWGLTFEDMMWYFNWLFVRGNNIIYPHAFFYSIRDKRRDERPPDVGPHSPWWSEYNRISDYIKRMCELLTDSTNKAEIAVLCREDGLDWRTVKPLFEHQAEFNYLEASLLGEAKITDEISIAGQHYSTLIIDGASKPTERELELLRGFGGRIIAFNCASPDGAISAQTESELVSAVRASTTRDFELADELPTLRVSHIEKDGEEFYILFNEGSDELDFELPFDGELWNPWDGTIKPAGKRLTLEKYRLRVLAIR